MNTSLPMSEGEAKRTDPLSFVVKAFAGLRNAVIPVLALAFATRGEGAIAWLGAIGLGLAIILFSSAAEYLRWRKFTYQVNQEDIRVAAGIFSRSARSVPFERIQDVSLEQTLVPRLFGLVSVKFETGSGGGEDISLSYLKEAEGERLRELVRDRREGAAQVSAESASETAEADSELAGKTLFAMGPNRLFTFGLFEFSLAVFAVLGGLAQYADTFTSIELWDPDLWQAWLDEQQGALSALGPLVQVVSAIAGLIALFVIGSATGLVRTFMRDWEFRLEETPRGFRRRRGLFTRTDVVMPIHRVQAVKINTKAIRYRFGWHGLKFVSLAQDAGAANHDVAPFAKFEEIAPIVQTAGFEMPAADLKWQRTDKRYWIDSALLTISVLVLAAIVVAIVTYSLEDSASPAFALLPLAATIPVALSHLYGFRVHAHALDAEQLISRRGWLSPSLTIVRRVKLHSVEIVQGPIARRRGYASLHLGLAGGSFAINGLPVERAQELRRAILSSINQADFSELYRAPAIAAQPALSGA